ncbi:hypothetical protein [Cellulomonas phragmiteti]|uniref:Pilus assembly protein n=1 Tax=Cellulomonas phragmiteti TaxID=478780 RepID=A0ABQ4DI97_9CELL|nr:hypothetical protein [Cellulomonas phragmiteti]GIG39076.1 hypothetical protein Cph01nite_08380 [Cellulomonas phragmiteti]
MENLTRRALAVRLAVTGIVLGAFDRAGRDDRGQGSVEYVGIILVVVAIIGVVIAAASGLGGTIVSRLSEAISGM